MDQMEPIDDIDLRLIEVLKHNSRDSIKKLSEKARIPMATLNRRMKKLIDNKIIKEFSTVIDYEKLGKATYAYIFFRSMPDTDQRTILTAASKHPEVEEMAAITGQYDIMIKARFENTSELSKFLFEKVRKFPSVAHTETFIGLDLKPFPEKSNIKDNP